MYKVNSDNCMVCGIEYSTKKLKSIASNFKICRGCLCISDPANDYSQVKSIISGYLKVAQVVDPELASPEIKIEPADTYLQKAVQLLKQINPSYFVGVRKIVVDSGGSSYGHVSSGKDQDPAVIHVNLQKIKEEVQNKIGNLPKDQLEKEIVRQLALTLSHERAHTLSYKENTGFEGGEAPAKNEENSMMTKIDNYYNTLR